MKVLVCGSRDWQDRATIRQWLMLMKRMGAKQIIEGGARGADRAAYYEARALGLSVREMAADWATHGKAAGPLRNREMLDLEPDIVLAFHDDPHGSKGTRDCVLEAGRRGIIVVFIGSREVVAKLVAGPADLPSAL